MSEEDFSNEALRHLLDELEPARRTALEARLAHDPEAAAEFKRMADGLAQFALETAPGESMTPAAQRATLAAILGSAVAGANRSHRAAPSAADWRRYLWPAAALLLLGLNAWQWVGRGSHGGDEPGGLSAGKAAATSRADLAVGGERRSGEAAMGVREGITAVGTTQGGERASPAEEARRLEKLRAEHAALKRASDALRAEYDGMLLDLAQRTIAGPGVGRMAAMELVDEASYARGERKGLVTLARGLLTTPGIVAAGPGTAPASPVTATPSAPTTEPGTTAVVPGVTTAVGTGAAVPGAPSNPTPVTPTPTPPATGADGGTDAPYAWSVYDETQGQGYLNLYNLPTVSADQTLQLWVKATDSGEYQSVGQVPATFYGGSGSIYYKLPDATATPTEILITREPKNAVGTTPTGPTILRGP